MKLEGRKDGGCWPYSTVKCHLPVRLGKARDPELGEKDWTRERLQELTWFQKLINKWLFQMAETIFKFYLSK